MNTYLSLLLRLFFTSCKHFTNLKSTVIKLLSKLVILKYVNINGNDDKALRKEPSDCCLKQTSHMLRSTRRWFSIKISVIFDRWKVIKMRVLLGTSLQVQQYGLYYARVRPIFSR